MTDKIFNLLQSQPLVSIILGFVLAGFIAWVFRGVITDFIKKKYGLYSEEEIKRAALARVNRTYLTSDDKGKVIEYIDITLEDLKR